MIKVFIQEIKKDRVVRTIQSRELFWSEADYGWFFREGQIYQYERRETGLPDPGGGGVFRARPAPAR